MAMKKRITPEFSNRWVQIIMSLVMMTSLLAGCRFPWQPSPDEMNKDAEAEQEQVATAEPRKDLPPALVEVYPLPNSIIALQQPITLYFNQSMDTDSVEAAIHFDPTIGGSFRWEDDQVLTFTPDQMLSPNTDLVLSINTSAQANNRKSLQDPVEIAFQTVESLQVVQTVPSDGTEDVDPESAIFTAFNQPVVALGAEADADPAFTLSPEVPGEGQWLNTSTYVFYPAPSMDGGTTYTIQLNENLQSTSGARFDASEVGEFMFSTTQPTVLNILPLPDEKLSLDGPIKIRFNIRMDARSVEEGFDLISPTGISIAGSFEWDEDNKTFAFTPDVTLARNATYTIRLGPGAESFGGLPIDASVEATRTTFTVFSTDPRMAPAFQNFYNSFGQYRLYFTTPLDKETYQDHISISPEVNDQNIYLGDGNTTLTITGFFQPELQYTLTLAGDLQDVWGGRLGEDVTYTFSTPPATSNLNIITGSTSHNLVFIPAEASELVMQATNINTVTLEISPISINDLITLLHPDNYDYRQVFMPESVEVSTQNLNLTRNINQVVTIPLSYQGNPLTPGVYFLSVFSLDITSETANQYHKLYLIVSDNHLVMKIAPDQALVWATQLGGYSPLSGAPVLVYNTEGDLLTSGRTDGEGLFTGNFERFAEPYTNFFALVGEPGEEDFAFSISTWGMGYALYEMGISLDTLPAQMEAYIYTDRPIYRPGDTIHFKAAIFGRDNGIPVMSDLETVTVTLYGDPGLSGIPTTLYDEELALTRFGTVEAAVALPEDAPPGYYRIELADDDSVIEVLYFDVATYRKPEIELQVVLDQAEIVAGETLAAEIQADYYFGVPASGQTFSWTLYQDDTFFNLPGYRVGPLNASWLTPRFQGYSPLGSVVASGEGETDEEGHVSLEFSPADLQLDDIPEGSLQEYNLEVTVMDESGFPVSYRDSALVHPEDFYIGVQPEAYFGIAESPFAFSVQTVDWEKQPEGNKPLRATFETIEWEVEETTNPEFPYRYVAKTTFVASASPVTNSEGKARLLFTPPDPGTYQLTLESGNAVTQVVIWVSGSSSAVWPRQTQNQVKLTPDAENYQPGQIAQIFFPNPFAGGAKALVTVERGRVMETQVLDIEGAGYTLQVPLTEVSIPNVYVSVMLLGETEDGDPDYRQGIINLPVAPISKTLNIELTLDHTKTEPGETVSATLTITDQQGNPVQGEFSIAVVDKAVLALVEPNSPPILDALYGNQPLSVQTSFSLKTYATQLALSAMDLGRGGGGDMMASTTIREDFPDTAYWQADVVTGLDGTARLEIPMPDTLTTWVVDVRGLTEAYLVGQTEAEILTQKELMIRPVTPRFLVDGDEVEMAAIVHNNTVETLDVDISLQGTGFTLADTASQTQRVTIAASDSTRVAWWGTVNSVETVNLVFQAVSGSLSDASTPVWGDLQVLRYTMPYTFSTSGQLTDEGQRLELVSLPMSIDPSEGTLTLELTPTLTSTLVEGLKALENTSDRDTVSILSRLLANLNAYLALSDLGINSPQLQENLEDLVGVGIHQLLEAQNFDGGWSWWAGNGTNEPSSDPFITAYVLLGLTQTAEAGLDVGEHFIDRAIEYLSSRLPQPGNIDSTWQLDRLAFQIYALRDSDLDLAFAVEGLFARRSELSPWAVALLALTLHDYGGANTHVNTLLTDLETRAVRSATGVHWESENVSWLLPGTPIFNTAVGVFTLAQLDPASTSLPMALRYLLAHRKSTDLWSSTFETAWSLMAITEALQGTGDYQADFDFQATLNETLIAEGTAAGTDSLTSIVSTTAIADLYPESPNALLIERSEGAGTLYYRADLQTYQPAATAAAVNKGISLSRAYYLAGEGCPGEEDCDPIESLVLDQSDPTQFITVALTLVVSHDMYNLMVEDFIPAGTEIVNQDFLTSQTLIEDPMPIFDSRSPFADGWGWWYFNDPQIYDDHVLWTADYVHAGTYTLTYQILPYQRGIYQVLPTHAWQYFFPEVQGTSAGDLFTID
jgi:hypothetical protein